MAKKTSVSSLSSSQRSSLSKQLSALSSGLSSFVSSRSGTSTPSKTSKSVGSSGGSSSYSTPAYTPPAPKGVTYSDNSFKTPTSTASAIKTASSVALPKKQEEKTGFFSSLANKAKNTYSNLKSGVSAVGEIGAKAGSALSGQVGALKSNLAKSRPAAVAALDYSQSDKIVNSPLTQAYNANVQAEKQAKLDRELQIGKEYTSTPAYQKMAAASGNPNYSSQTTVPKVSSGNPSGSRSGGMVNQTTPATITKAQSPYAGAVSALKSLASGFNSSQNTAGIATPSLKPNQYQETTKVGDRNAIETVTNQSQANQPGVESEITSEQREAQKERASQLEAERSAQAAQLQSVLQQKQQELALALSMPQMEAAEGEDKGPSQLEKIQSEIDELNREWENLQQPSEEENQLIEQENALLAREAKIQADLKGAKTELGNQPIPYGFITGQQSYAENRANADLQGIAADRIPLTQKLATLQARRQASQDVAKSRLSDVSSRYKDERDYQRDLQKEERAAKKPIEIGGALIDPITGLPIYQPEQKQETQVVSYGNMQYLIDKKTGQVIKTLGPNSYKPSDDGISNPFQ